MAQEVNNQLIHEKNNDIYRYPSSFNSNLDSSRQLTIGDLHGNSIKLLYILIKENVLLMDKFSFDEMVKIYKKIPDNFDNLAVLYRDAVDDNGKNIFLPVCHAAFEIDSKDSNFQIIQSEDLVYFKDILKTQTKINNKPNLIRLLGDELADRGNNDLLTILLLEFLVANELKIEILLSNHNVQFINCYELQKTFIGDFMRHFQSASLSALQILLNRNLVTMPVVLEFINKIYKPNVKLISCAVNEAKDHITIFSHAAIGLEVIASLCKKFNVIYDDNTALSLAKSIENINKTFSGYLANNKVHTLFDANVMYIAAAEYPIDANKYPIVFVLWNRNYVNLNRPEKINNYAISFVHGHDMEKSKNNIIGLDNKLGKRGRAERLCHSYPNEHDYEVIISTEK